MPRALLLVAGAVLGLEAALCQQSCWGPWWWAHLHCQKVPCHARQMVGSRQYASGTCLVYHAQGATCISQLLFCLPAEALGGPLKACTLMIPPGAGAGEEALGSTAAARTAGFTPVKPPCPIRNMGWALALVGGNCWLVVTAPINGGAGTACLQLSHVHG